MRHIQIPYDVEIKPWKIVLDANPDAKPEKMSFLRYATFMWIDDPRSWIDEAGKQSVVKLRRWQKVIDKFEAAKPGEYVALDDEDYAVLVKIVESPAKVFQGAPTQVALACLPFIDAVVNAVEELPSVVANGQATASA